MKKLFIISLVSLIPMTSLAKYDFNAMIAENNMQQKALAKEVQKTLKVKSKEAPRARIVVTEEGQQAFIAKTNKGMLIFNKEKWQHTVSEKKAFDRIATELSQVD